MILLSLEDSEDIALCGGEKRVCNGTHLRKHLTMDSTKANKQHDIWNAYSRGMT